MPDHRARQVVGIPDPAGSHLRRIREITGRGSADRPGSELHNRRRDVKYWDDAWGLVGGCTPCSPGCCSCWSAAAAHMRSHQKNQKIRTQYEGLTCLRNGIPTYNGTIRLFHDRLEAPKHQRIPTVYALWNDIFHQKVPGKFINEAWLVMRNCPDHIFLILTKRIGRALEWTRIAAAAKNWPIEEIWPDNVWIIPTVCNQDEANRILPLLFQIQAPNIGISLEPMLGPVDLTDITVHNEQGEWHFSALECDVPREDDTILKGNILGGVIFGFETGPHARPGHPDWARKVRNDCAAAGVSLLFKQWGEWYPDSDLGQIKDTKRPGQCRKGQPSCYAHLLGEAGSSDRETDILMRRVGSKSAGRLLDGREHNDIPWRTS